MYNTIKGGETMLENLLTNPEQITFTVLFVGLLVYVMKTNDNREKQYRETIDNLTTHLETVHYIKEKVDNVSKFIYKNTDRKEED